MQVEPDKPNGRGHSKYQTGHNLHLSPMAQTCHFKSNMKGRKHKYLNWNFLTLPVQFQSRQREDRFFCPDDQLEVSAAFTEAQQNVLDKEVLSCSKIMERPEEIEPCPQKECKSYLQADCHKQHNLCYICLSIYVSIPIILYIY